MPQEESGIAEDVKVVEYHSIGELVCPVYIGGVLGHAIRATAIAVLPLHALKLGYSYDDVGILVGLLGVGSMSANLPAGSFVTRHGPRSLALVSYILHFSSSLLFAAAPNFTTLGLAMFLLGNADSTGILARTSILAATVPKSIRGKAMSTLGGVARISYTVFPPIGGFLAHRVQPRAVFIGQAALASAAFAQCYARTPTISIGQEIGKAANSQSSSPPVSTFYVFRAHAKSLIISCTFVMCLSLMRRARELLFSLAGHELELSEEHVGYFMCISYGLDAVLFPLAGWLLDNFGRTRTGALSSVSFAVAVAFLFGNTWWLYVCFSVASGWANGISAGIVQVIGADLAPSDCRGQFLAIYRTLGQSADILSPLTLGFVAESFSLQAAEMVVSAIGLLGAIWVLACVRETGSISSVAVDNPTATLEKPENIVAPKRVGKYSSLEDEDVEMPDVSKVNEQLGHTPHGDDDVIVDGDKTVQDDAESPMIEVDDTKV